MSAVLEKTNPDWFKAASKKLDQIEAHKDEYEDEAEGDVAPSAEIFVAVRKFLGGLNLDDRSKLEEPRVFVSPNGEIVLTYGNKNRSMDICFTPKIFFAFKDSSDGEKTGTELEAAVKLVNTYFQV